MTYSTTNPYQLKRDILTFSSKCSNGLSQADKKFSADMIYGMLKKNSCLLSDVADALQEKVKKKNTVERLAKHLAKMNPGTFMRNYLGIIRQWATNEPVIHIDDSDVIKPCGHKFESLGWVRDGSASTSKKTVMQKGYHVTEATILLNNNHPVSFFSRIHSSHEKKYTSANTITDMAINQGVALFKKATYVMDRGYDHNRLFLLFEELEQDYVIRLTAKRKVYFHNKWFPVTELCQRRKGKIKLPVVYGGEKHHAYLSHVKVQITASKKDMHLVLVYGLSKNPMMLATNKPIKSKDDVVKIAKLYFSRWRIEEYFRCKKQTFDFENFRVRSLKAINNLNLFMTACMAFLAHISLKSENHSLKALILKKANALKEKISFFYYRFAKGIAALLAYAHSGIQQWFKVKRPKYRQLSFLTMRFLH